MKAIKRDPASAWFNKDLGEQCKIWGKEYKNGKREWSWPEKSCEDWEKLCGKAWEKLQKEYKKTGDSKLLWPTEKRLRLNHVVFLPFLRKMTQGHCSFCEVLTGVRGAEETIEHFNPKGKSKYKKVAYQWKYLFLACGTCQNRKGEQEDEKLLKPDEKGYQFDDYFKWNFKTGKIEPNTESLPENQKRANITIELYRLNEEMIARERLDETAKYLGYKEGKAKQSLSSKDLLDLNEWPYSFFIQKYIERYGDTPV